jgi:protease I
MTMPNIAQSKILVIATHGFEQSELEVPRDALRERGAEVHVATLDGGPATGWDKGGWGREAPADLKISEAAVADYDALVLPGGQINPDILRTDADAVGLVREFVARGLVVAAICHAPWLLVEAGVAEGREMTSYHSIATDVKNAGAHWQDKPVAVSNGIVTSRNPGDLEAFVGKIVEEIEEGRHARDAA